ncbi:MAG: TauD/TfdA dioxygenase family protein [Sphingobium sp.]
MTISTRIAQEYTPLNTQDFQTDGFAIRHLSPFIGTEILGLDLKQEQGEKVREQLRQLLNHRGVLHFPDQNLSPGQQLAATAIWGTPSIHSSYREGAPLPGVGIIDSAEEIAGRVSRWHADVTAAEVPTAIRLLQAIELPPHGGDTHWASTEAAYARLSPALRELADQLTAIHTITPVTLDDFHTPRSKFQWAEHPVVRVHPDTGRRALYVNPRFTKEIVGLKPHESADLLNIFFNHITVPEHTIRIQWQVGALAVWDNRTSLHYAADDYGQARRRLQGTSAGAYEPAGVAA